MTEDSLNILSNLNQKSFPEFYKEIINWFKSKSKFKCIRSNTCKGLRWPSDSGVYVIKEIETGKPLYIGMTGYFSGEGKFSDKQGLDKRAARWNPYCFSKSGPNRNKFCYGPLYEKKESRQNPPKDYREKLLIKEIEVDCLLVSKDERIAPAFIESLLLQVFLAYYGKLPKGNNKF
jgi:hypothetical protein